MIAAASVLEHRVLDLCFVLAGMLIMGLVMLWLWRDDCCQDEWDTRELDPVPPRSDVSWPEDELEWAEGYDD